MKGTQINLLLYKEDYRNVERLFKRIRLFALFYSAFLVITLVVFYIMNINVKTSVSKLEIEKQRLLGLLTSRSKEEAGLIYITKKAGLIDQYLVKDVKFLPYYNFMLDKVKAVGSPSASLETFAVDNNRKATFSITFTSAQSMLEFLKFIESDEFLNNFDSLVATRIGRVVSEGQGTNTLEIAFEGQFKSLDENRH